MLVTCAVANYGQLYLMFYFRLVKTPMVHLFWSKADVISSVNSVRAIHVDILALNPNILLFKLLYLSIYVSNLLWNSYSKNLENCGSRDIGI